MSDPDIVRFQFTPMFWIGCAILIAGSGPLLAIMIAAYFGFTSDPDPNPIGPGLLAFFTFWPGIILSGAALVTSIDRYKAARRRASL
jgi:hypothetical protein